MFAAHARSISTMHGKPLKDMDLMDCSNVRSRYNENMESTDST